MGNRPPIEFSKVPLIGAKPAIIHEVRSPLVVATCPCGNPKPIIITDFNQRVECTQCKDEHFIAKLSVVSDGGGGQVDISLGRRAHVPGTAKH